MTSARVADRAGPARASRSNSKGVLASQLKAGAARASPAKSGAAVTRVVQRAAAGAAVAETPRGLVWVSDDVPGIRRIRDRDGFAYVGPDGKRIRNAEELRRIRALAIPPAYEEVWICTRANGHLQATGRDARGRKQYRYHPDWRVARDADKFERMLEFGAALPRIRKRVAADLAAPVATRPKRETVLATIVRLLDTTHVRIGNEEYARTNRSYGLTTLRNRHAAVSGDRLQLRFRGKSGKEHELALDDPRVARVVRRCQAMPGQDLFQYVDEDGTVRGVGSADVNDYIREASGADFTAKDFRTWHGTAHALALWIEGARAADGTRRSVKELLGEVARQLGNTVAVCKKSYVHPRVLEALATEVDDDLIADLDKAASRRGLQPGERRLLAFLKRK